MPETKAYRWSWLFIALAVVSGLMLLLAAAPTTGSDDHEIVRELRDSGAILPLADLLMRPALRDKRVVEAELERENGRLVYELELLDEGGRIREQDFDAVSGEPIER